VDDRALLAAADAVMARYEEMVGATSEADRALVHGDLGVHNMNIDADTLHVHGIYDWGSACWADPHLDFTHFVFENANYALVDAAIAAYEPATGRSVSRPRIFLYNAVLAIDHLAFRVGLPAEEKWGARTLAEDLHWTRYALARVAASPVES
jgi:aminoglycoside phosphotransferase (APT) family kinase protein